MIKQKDYYSIMFSLNLCYKVFKFAKTNLLALVKGFDNLTQRNL